MRELSFYLLLVSVFFPIRKAYKNGEELFQLPFLYSMAMIVYILPTLFGVLYNDALLSDSQYIRYCLFAFCCFWAGIAGYRLFSMDKEKYLRRPVPAYDERKLMLYLYCVMISSFLALLAIGSIDPNERQGGAVAVLAYPARALRPATIILLIACLLNPTRDKVFFLALSFLFSLKIIVVDGRRSETFNLLITIIMPLFFIKKFIPHRIFILPTILFAIFIFTFLPAARQYTLRGQFSTVFTLSPQELIMSQLTAESTNEVVDAAKNMEVTEANKKYNWGITAYNSFIFQYASSNLFGKELKEGLMFKPAVDLEKFRYQISRSDDDEFKFYLAPTGFAAVFFEFGYGGFLLFFAFGMLTKFYYQRAKLRTNMTSVIFYCMYSIFIFFSVYDSILIIPTMIILYLVVFGGAKLVSGLGTITANSQSLA